MGQKFSNYFGSDTPHTKFRKNLLKSSGDKASHPIGTTFLLRADYALQAKIKTYIIAKERILR